jgi:choice-of-anchor B domain-containing protein
MQATTRSLLAALTAASLLSAQNAPQNITLMSKLTNGAQQYAAVWGYTDPVTNREFAVVGAFNGTWIVDTTDPANPVTITTLTAGSTTSSNQWREMTGYKQYVYSVSEAQAGIRVIDMSIPTSPVDKGLVHTADWSNTHSIHCDPDAGRIYPCGTNKGMFILDATADPVNLPILGVYTTTYVHETFCRRNRGYFAHINAGTSSGLRIANITNPAAIVSLSLTKTPFQAPATSGATHNAWVTDDDRIMVTTGENANAKVGVYDIANPAAPVLKSTYWVAGAIDHDVFGIGRTAFLAYYTDGIHILDISNPTVPRRIAYYDTHALATAVYDGSWGVYPYTDSGIVYASDIHNGLFCLRVDNGHMNRYGDGVAGVNGVPRIQFDGASPMVDAAAMELRVSKLDPNAPFKLVLSAGKGSTTVFGVTIHVDLNNVIVLSGTADANGKATIPLPVPNDPGLGNGKVYMQVLSTSGSGFIASRGHWFGIVP